MRLTIQGFVALVLLGLTALPIWFVAADEARSGEERPADDPAEDLSPDEREAALRKAEELRRKIKALYGEGKHKEALPLAREELALRERVLGPSHKDLLSSLGWLAAVLRGDGQDRAAVPICERALEVSRTSYGAEHPETAKALNNLAALLKTTSQYERARPLFEEALRIQEKARGPNHPALAEPLHNLAGLLVSAGELEAAEVHARRAHSIVVKKYGPDHPRVAMSLLRLADVHRTRGEHAEALRVSQESLRIAEKAFGSEHRLTAQVLNNVAVILNALGRVEDARACHERVLAILERELGHEHPWVATSLNNLAAMLHDTGQFEQARRLRERAVTVAAKALGPQSEDVAVYTANLAETLRQMGRFEEAQRHHERSLALFETLLGPGHTRVATALGNLAALHAGAGRHDEAERLYDRALRIREEALGPDHPEVVPLLAMMADNLRRIGRTEDAARLYERARSILDARFGDEHRWLALLLRHMADLERARGAYDKAASLLANSLDLVERDLRRRFAGFHESERRGMRKNLRRSMDSWQRLAPYLEQSGYPEVLRFKGLVGRATAADRRLVRLGGAAVEGRIEAMRAAERRLAALAHAMPPMFRRQEHRAWREQYARAALRREELVRSFAGSASAPHIDLERQDLVLADIQARLGRDAVLVDYLRLQDRYLAWVVGPKGPPHRVDLGEAEAVERAAAQFTKLSGETDEEFDEESWRAAGRALGDLVWTPIRAHLGRGVRAVYLCPDAALASVPFIALPGRKAGDTLIDEFLLTHVTMAQDLVPWPGASDPGKGAIAVGDVDFETAAEHATRPLESGSPGVAAVDRAPRGGRFYPLPDTRAEVEFVRARLGSDCLLLTGADAVESRFREAAPGRRFLHLATHGFVRTDLMRGLHPRGKTDSSWLGGGLERKLAAGHDPMNLAGLAMAGANTRQGGSGEDGILTAMEASHLDLEGVEVVVLSACQTALGKAESGEGVLGLVQGFQAAGARKVIASLWQVDDEATRILMQHLYEAMLREEDPLPAAAALREACLAVRGSTGENRRSLASPRYWAAFVVYGK